MSHSHATALEPPHHGPDPNVHRSPPHPGAEGASAARRDSHLPDTLGPTARFTLDTLKRDAPAGIITGLMAIPLTVGICMMSQYPVQIGLLTVVVACVISFLVYLVRPGNHVGVPGVAAGLAPVLALGIHEFGAQNMPWLIFLTSVLQMVVWYYRLEAFILKAVPTFLVEGLLAGVGLKIALHFLPETYAIVGETEGAPFWSGDRILMIGTSVAAFGLFLFLYRRFKDTSPGVPYIAVLIGGVALSFWTDFPMLEVERVPFALALPFPDFSAIPPEMHLEMFAFAAMLATIDVIEQVMSNAAIEKIDPFGRPANSNNSLLVMWLGNLASSFFGGMTNLDGLAKSSTNRMAGAVTKMSVLFVALVLGLVVAFPSTLDRLPVFTLAVLMIFTGGKMILGLYHVAQHGRYELGLALLCGLLVYEDGIFEALVSALAIHSFITYVVYRHDKVPTLEILKKLVLLFTDKVHPHSTATLAVHHDPASGGLRYSTVRRPLTKDLDAFIGDWAHGVNAHNLLAVTGTYDTHGLLWGTFAKELRSGHFHIRQYFEHLFELDHVRVHFDTGETRQYHDIFIRSGSYTFSFLRKGQKVAVPARYSFVCKKEHDGWYILEHHSSEFPA